MICWIETASNPDRLNSLRALATILALVSRLWSGDRALNSPSFGCFALIQSEAGAMRFRQIPSSEDYVDHLLRSTPNPGRRPGINPRGFNAGIDTTRSCVQGRPDARL